MKFGFRSIRSALKSQPVIIGVAGLLVVLCLNSVIAYMAAEAIAKRSAGISNTMQTTLQLDSVLAAVYRAESVQRGYLLTRDGGYFTSFNVADYDVQKQLDNLSEMLIDVPSQRVNLSVLTYRIKRRLDALTSEIDTVKDLTSDRGPVPSKLAEVDMEGIRAATYDMETEQNRLLSEERALRDRNQLYLSLTFWLSTFINILLVVRMAVLVRRILAHHEHERWREHRYALDANQRKEELEHEVERRKEAELAVTRLNEELEERVAVRTKDLTEAYKEAEGFNYSISHDLRAPLRAIVSSSRILMEDFASELSPAALHELSRQSAAANKMARLIDDLLHLSRLSRQEMVLQQCNLTELAASVVKDLEERPWKIEPKITIEPHLWVEGDPTLLHLMLTNLLENACKFSPDGPRVEVGREQTDRGEAFFVRDHGIGIDTKYAHKVFLPFERLVNDAEFEGTGIGLANVKRIVERHGGTIWIESELSKGTTFFFTLEQEETSSQKKKAAVGGQP